MCRSIALLFSHEAQRVNSAGCFSHYFLLLSAFWPIYYLSAPPSQSGKGENLINALKIQTIRSFVMGFVSGAGCN